LDGSVLTNDYSVLSANFFDVGDALPGPFVSMPIPRKSISTKELARLGVPQAFKMDRDADGWVTMDEVFRFVFGG
jgi:hypothetical protein